MLLNEFGHFLISFRLLSPRIILVFEDEILFDPWRRAFLHSGSIAVERI
jgi:hypothetical protein